MSAPDLYEQVLQPIAERFWNTAADLRDVPNDEFNRTAQAWYRGRLDALQEVGDLIADALEVAAPEWDHMREAAR